MNSDTMKALVQGMYQAYVRHWRESQVGIAVERTEETFESPLFVWPKLTQHPTFAIAGKLDKVVRINGRLILVDHKTTSLDISPGSTYWRQLQIDSQHHHYDLLLLANGIRVDGIMWDVARKPLIRPKKLTKAQCEEFGFEYGQIEPPGMFAERVAGTMLEDPDKYFQRQYIHKDSGQLARYAEELSQVADDIDRCRDEDTSYRNPGACMLYGSPCEFLGVCSGEDSIFSDRWATREETHAELDLVDGTNVLTNSRIRCFQTCRRKHHYKYELQKQRREHEDSQALQMGTLWHDLMDTFWGEPCATT